MSTLLLSPTIDYLRNQFTAAEVATLEPYGGQFSAEEIDQVSYRCPAVFVTVLGWQPLTQSQRVPGRHVRTASMAAFVATKNVKRAERMAQAMALADKLCAVLQAWSPTYSAGDAVMLGPLDSTQPSAENLYGRAIDRAGQALWLVRWKQDVKVTLPLPQLYDLLAVEIIDTTRQGRSPADASRAGSLTVTEEVNFAPLPPAAG